MGMVIVNNTDNTPIYALRLKTKQKLSCMLNGTKVVHSPDGLPRDWRGFAELIGMDMSFAFSVAHSNPMEKILIHWADNNPSNYTIKQLRLFLEKLDRYDVLDDISDLIDADIAEYNCRSQNNIVDRSPLYLVDESQILTVDDIARLRVGREAQFYDAFVLYVDSDEEFAFELIKRMEQCTLKLCVKDRDIVGGHNFEHEAIMKLLSQRCNRLVVVLSKDFLNSYANHFFITYAQAIGIEQRMRKVIPCIYQNDVREMLPVELKSYFILDWTRSNNFSNFWRTLYNSIIVPSMLPPNALYTRDPCERKNDFPSIMDKESSSDSSGSVGIKELKEGDENSMVLETVKRKSPFTWMISKINRTFTKNHSNKSIKKSNYKMQTT